MLGDGHVRFGGRAMETDRPKDRHRAMARPLPMTAGSGSTGEREEPSPARIEVVRRAEVGDL